MLDSSLNTEACTLLCIVVHCCAGFLLVCGPNSLNGGSNKLARVSPSLCWPPVCPLGVLSCVSPVSPVCPVCRLSLLTMSPPNRVSSSPCWLVCSVCPVCPVCHVCVLCVSCVCPVCPLLTPDAFLTDFKKTTRRGTRAVNMIAPSHLTNYSSVLHSLVDHLGIFTFSVENNLKRTTSEKKTSELTSISLRKSKLAQKKLQKSHKLQNAM